MHGDGRQSAPPINTGHTTVAIHLFAAPLTKKKLNGASEFIHVPKLYQISCLIFNPGLVHLKIVHSYAFH